MARKTPFILAILGLFAVPFFALALTVKTDKSSVDVGGTEEVKNLVAASGIVTVSQEIKGDAIIVGGVVTVNKSIEKDLIVSGGTVTVNGSVGGDLRAFGGTVVVNSTVGGNVLAGAGSVSFASGADVKGDVVLGAGSVSLNNVVEGDVLAGSGDLVLAGTVKGKVLVSVGNIQVKDSAVVGGSLEYTAPTKGSISDRAKINGGIQYHERQMDTYGWNTWGAWVGIMVWLAMVILVGLFLIYVFPQKSHAVAKDAYESFWVNLGLGFAVFILGAVAIILLLVSVVGMMAASIVGLFYTLVLIISTVYSSLVLGSGLLRLLQRREWQTGWQALILGVLAMTLVTLFPFVGWFAGFILFLATLGSLVRYDYRLFTKLRQAKDL